MASRHRLPGHCMIPGALLLATLMASLVGCSTLGAGSTDVFFIQDAELQDAGYLHRLDQRAEQERFDDRERFGVFVHRIRAGSGTVIGYRHFDRGSLAIDDELFEKLTIWIPGGMPAEAWQADIGGASGIVVAISRGGSAWPTNMCSGYLTRGKVGIEPAGRGARVTVTGELTPGGNRGVRPCERRVVDFSFVAKPAKLGAVTPWLGAAGDHVYEETYRR